MEEITIIREELYEKIWATPLTQLAKELKISEIGLRKKCIKRNIPLPKSGHWSKVRHGKKVRKISLPDDEDQTPVTLYIRDDNGVPFDPTIDERIKIKHQITTLFKEYLEPTIKLTKPHHLVKAAKAHLANSKLSYDGYLTTVYGQYLSVSATKGLIPLALRVFNSFIRLAVVREHKITVANHSTLIIVDEIKINIDIRERQKRVIDESMSTHYTYHKNIPSGVLCLRMNEQNKREWDNIKKPIESQFPSIFATLELYAKKEKQWKIEAEKARIKREAEKKIEQEQYALKVEEFKKFKQLLEDAERWKKAEVLRSYINHKKSNLANDDWIEWASKKADWIDPNLGIEDDILGEYSLDPPAKPGYW